MPVGAAIAGSALLGAYSSKRASDKQASATKEGLQQSSALAEQSRKDAINLYNQGIKSASKGLSSAFDFYKQAAPAKYSPITQSGVAAQNAIGQGATQANNAILGLPVDMSFANPQQINPDISFISGESLPQRDKGYLDAMQGVQSPSSGISGLLGQNIKNTAKNVLNRGRV